MKLLHCGTVFTFIIFLPLSVSFAGTSPCAARGTAIAVDTDSHTLYLCESDSEAGYYKIALGSGGTGKRKAHDNKTPLGHYALGAPHPSSQFTIFIPIAYPTSLQRSQGFSGSDVGLHGPKKGFTWLESANTWVDWTRGCIAVGTVQAIQAIATWVTAHHVRDIFIY